MEKMKVIIDTDPGVDDATCLLFALTDKRIDTKLITVCPGNVSLDQATKTTLYLLDLVNKDVPVVRGREKQIENAESLHGKGTLGGVKLPKTTRHKETKDDVADAMYRVLCDNPNEITFLCCAPQTNMNYLLTKYPDAKKLIKQIILMGGSFGLPNNPNHISYNARADYMAMKFVLESKIPCIVIHSLIGRTFARFTKKQVEMVKNCNNFGAFLAKTFDTYWEPGFSEQFVSHNDVCTYLYLVRPDMFTTKNGQIEINTTTNPGKLTFFPNDKSHLSVIESLDRKKFLNFMFYKIKNYKDFNYQNN